MKKILVIAFFLVSLPAFAAKKPIKHTYVTEYKVGTPTTSTVTEKSFKSISNAILKQHADDFAERNLDVKLNHFWEKSLFTFWVNKEGQNEFSINLWGGIARIPGMNDYGLALFICHEVGHILGGTPYFKNKFFLWSSVEGQSDYFATSICLKKYFKTLAMTKKLKQPIVNTQIIAKCKTKYHNVEDILICKNVMSAIEVMAKVFNFIDPTLKNLDLFKRSPEPKVYTYDSYPSAQCRIETLRAGNFCAPDDFPCEDKDGKRPKCWFKN